MKRPDPFIRLSASKIQATNCWYYFYRQYLDEAAGRGDVVTANTPIYLTIGRFCHKVLEEYNKILLKHGIGSDMEMFSNVYDAVWSVWGNIPEKMHDELKDMMIAFAETHVIDKDTTWGAEVPIALDWDLNPVDFEDPFAWLRAKLDRINIYPKFKTAVITDYKTARWIPGEADLKKSLQALLYPFLLMKINPYLTNYTMVWHFIRWNKKVEINFTKEDMEKTEHSLRLFTQRLSKKIEANKNPEDWAAITGENCGICRYECPLASVEFQPLQTSDHAKNVAMQIISLERKTKKLKESIKDFVKASEERIDLADGYYDYVPQTILQGIKPEAVIEVCKAQGKSINLVLAFDSDKFKKLTDQEFADAIASLGKPAIRSYFKFIPSQPEEEGVNE